MQSENSLDKLNTGKGHERGAFQRSRLDMNPAQSYAPVHRKIVDNLFRIAICVFSDIYLI